MYSTESEISNTHQRLKLAVFSGFSFVVGAILEKMFLIILPGNMVSRLISNTLGHRTPTSESQNPKIVFYKVRK